MEREDKLKYMAIAALFEFDGEVQEISPFGSGHINDTLRVVCVSEQEEKHYILQRINTAVFRDPDGLMNNIAEVTAFLRKKVIAQGGNPEREVLCPVKTRTEELYCRSEEGECWRAYLCIDGATCYDMVEKPEDFYQAGRGFGHFQALLSDYPAQQLRETIPDFHHTPKRFEAFCRAVEEDCCGRKAEVLSEIQFVMNHADDMQIIQQMMDDGEMPLRVTHNDTKLNNVMIDDVTGKALCVLDLDTVMPGTAVFDFGDSIRFGANTAAEDETDLSKVSLSLELFEAYTKGFLESCGHSLTETEKLMLPMGAKIMTLECGMRFLMDYLQGDVYFKIHREKHNLDRARTQFALVRDMERKWTEMERIVKAQG